MRAFLKSASAIAIMAMSATSFAGMLPVFNGWTQIANDDTPGATYYVNPGYGGQAFDAEYLFIKQDGNLLSVGLQTGFDVISKKGQKFENKQFYTGDLALSFDGNKTNYEYAIDFGNLSKGYHTDKTISSQGVNVGTGVDAAGLYKANSWNNDIYYTQSVPYAMSNGSLVVAANGGNFQEGSGVAGGETSFFNIFTFDLSNIAGLGQDFVLDAHWTMSCGNDVVEGRVNLSKVPEPTPFVLFALGIAGLFAARRKTK
ncbi:MAG: PEP-CTERM sorting domain-containing protein [Moraxellaceae bacterium]|nr:MAG: PEP-CTERM sorting domain-containing protein [Moraxellaceae bacterium]